MNFKLTIDPGMEGRRNVEREPRPTESFSEQLGRVWKERYPEAVAANLEQQKDYREKVVQTENRVRDREALEILEEYGIHTESIEQIGEDLFRIPVKSHFSDRPLPPGYYYIGGAARALLMRSLEIDPSYAPRDLDLQRLEEENPDGSMDRVVAQDFSPDDLEHGHGVQVAANAKEYFASRDLSLNEVLADDREVMVTRQGLLDSVRGIIRVTEHEKSELDYRSGSKLMAKILRLYVEGINRWGDAKIEAEYFGFEPYFIAPFYLALQLDKSAELSIELAESYVRKLVEHGQLPNDIVTVEDAASYLSDFLREGDSFYRHAPTDQFDLEAEWADAESLPKHQGHGRVIREKS